MNAAERVDEIMSAVPPDQRWLPWCQTIDGPCACVGCVNMFGGVGSKITYGMWSAWFARHDRRSGHDRRRQ